MRIGPVFGRKALELFGDRCPQPNQHVAHGAIAPDQDACLFDLGRQVAVADVPGEPGEMHGIAAANLDPAVFDDPLEVKLDRSPNPHIAFAAGFHRCLGSHLARLELRVSLEEFHRRIPDYRIAEGIELHYWGAVRAPRPLPLVWG